MRVCIAFFAKFGVNSVGAWLAMLIKIRQGKQKILYDVNDVAYLLKTS